MKKIKIIIGNFLIFLFIFFVLDIITYNYLFAEYNVFHKTPKVKDYIQFITRPLTKKDLENEFLHKGYYYRPIQNKNSTKSPILLFGCSFTYGEGGLSDTQTVSYKLGGYTQRPIYNRGLGGLGPQHMLWQLQSDYFYNIIPEPEYAIYIYIDDHLRRTFLLNDPIFDSLSPVLYKEINNKLVLDNIAINMCRFPLINYIKHLYIYRFILNERRSNKNLEIFKLYFLTSKQEMNKHWQKTKFIIFAYEDEKHYIKNIERFLINNNIKVIYASDIVNVNLHDRKYVVTDGRHPNAAAWDAIVPALVKKLGCVK